MSRGGRRGQGLGHLVRDRAAGRDARPRLPAGARPRDGGNAAGRLRQAPAVVGSSTPPAWPIHVGQVCQGGTTCLATLQARRLGDYFTITLERRGCVLIATGATWLADPTTVGPLPPR